MRKLILSFVIGVAMANAFGQESVFSEPVALSNLINTEDEELAPMLSPDGKTLYFIRAFHEGNEGGRYAGSDIWMSKKDDEGNWMPAARMEFGWNNKRANAVIGINKDQTVVYLLNAYSNKSGIAFSKFNSGLWGEPEFIPIPGIAKDDFVGFYVNPQFDVILISMRGKDSLGEEDIYLSLKDSFGNWTEPRNLGPTINTKGFEISPFLSEDKKRLYFSSNGHGGFGDADIFYCDRLFDSWETWSVPRNLGKEINTIEFEGYFLMMDTYSLFVRAGESKRAEILYSHIAPKEVSVRTEVVEQYLSRDQIVSLVGLDPVLTFNSSEEKLTESNKQILNKVCSAIVGRQEYKCFLVAVKLEAGSDLEKYQKRLLLVLDYMRTRGVEGSRISLGVETFDISKGQVPESVIFKILKTE